jgi:hypothetical protein
MKNLKVFAGLIAILFVFICACCQLSKTTQTTSTGITPTAYYKSGIVIASPTTIPTSRPTEKGIKRTATTTRVKPSNTPTTVVETQETIPIVTAKDTNVNLRSGPGTNYDVVGSLKKGESLKTIGRNSDSSWWQVSNGNAPAWVFAGVVTITGADDEIAIVEAPPPPATPFPTPTIVPTWTPIPVRVATIPSLSPNTSSCCKHCGPNSKACGDSCISKNKNCKKGPGCACN